MDRSDGPTKPEGVEERRIAEVSKQIDDLVSDLACCDRSGCKCWEAQQYTKAIAEYAIRSLALAEHGEMKRRMTDNEAHTENMS